MVGNPALCVSPPYDQFDPAMIKRLEAQSPYNVARLVKARPDWQPDLTGEHYRRAAALMNEWITGGALVPDEGPGFYPYSQSYTVGSDRLTRWGFIALGDLRDAGVHTHEETHSHVREDRCRLRLATAADFGLIFLIYSDPAQAVDRLLRDCESGEPIFVAEQPDGSIHRLYSCRDLVRGDRVIKHMAAFDCVIADGHHRAAAAFDSWRTTQDESWAYAAMAFFNADAPGMTVLPIHRAVARDRTWRFENFLERLSDDFEVLELPAAGLSPRQVVAHLENQVQHQQHAERVAFGMIGPDPNRAFLVEAPVPLPHRWPWPANSHPSWRGLATAIFETGVLRSVLGYSDGQIDAGTGMEFTKDAAALIDWVRTERYQLGFLLPATSLASILEVARLGQNLPRKSTFFFPKLLTGLTIHRMEPVSSM
ncbi:MAG: DUF1015 domain-containing protein [candidate division Zixibacteria bacterium]|nr:DUF1015 domain-containing protein [candidate division Zixibacteria bacterium]